MTDFNKQFVDMAIPEETGIPPRVFTIAEATELLPQLHARFVSIHRAKNVLERTSREIERASANAVYGGGSHYGVAYIQALSDLSANLQAISELGVVVKDVHLGLCDFPFLHEGRMVFLCWKFGETDIRWWHEMDRGYKDRCPLE